jgi:FkbM family methyltransferase
LAGITTVVTLRDKRRFHIDSGSYLEWYLLFFGPYEPEITNLLSSLLDQDSTVVDVGANVGIHTLSMARLAPAGKVLAFEPHPVTVERLRANLSLNEVDNVRVFQVALLDEQREVSLYDSEGSNRGMATLHSYEGWTEMTVPGVTLDEVVRKEGIPTIDLIKIDVEGYESQVIAGASAVLARDRPSLIFEYVDWAWRNCGYTLDQTMERLRSIGYDQFYLVERNGILPLPDPLLVSGNILALGRSAQGRLPNPR